MEILRSWGIQDEVERAGMPREDVLAVGVGTSLSAGDYLRKAAAIAEDAAQSPTYTYLCSQDVLEVILRRVAASAADVRFGTTMTDLRIDRDGVVATVVAGGVATQVRARYLIAADGGRSAIRERLGIAVEGPPRSATWSASCSTPTSTSCPPAAAPPSPSSAAPRAARSRRSTTAVAGSCRPGTTPPGRQRRRLHRGVLPGRRTFGDRHPRPPGRHRRRDALAPAGRGRRRVRQGPRLPGRGRRPRGHPAGRVRHELRHPGRAQPGLEAGRRPARRGRPATAGHLRGGTPPDRCAHRGREPGQRHDHVPDDGRAAVHARGHRAAGGAARVGGTGAGLPLRLGRRHPGRHAGARAGRSVPDVRADRPPGPPRPARLGVPRCVHARPARPGVHPAHRAGQRMGGGVAGVGGEGRGDRLGGVGRGVRRRHRKARSWSAPTAMSAGGPAAPTTPNWRRRSTSS